MGIGNSDRSQKKSNGCPNDEFARVEEMKKIYFGMCWILVLLFFAGCVYHENIKETPEIKPSETPQRVVPTETITQTPSDTPLLNTPRPTRIPTLAESEREKWLADLFEENLQCELPCWWGMIPGKTNRAEAEQMLWQLQNDGVNGIKQDGTYRMKDYAIASQFTTANVPYLFVYIRGNKETIETIQVYSLVHPGYSLDRILRQYGAPDEVRIASVNWGREKPPFLLYLLYLKKGFVILYDAEDKANYTENTIQACLTNQSEYLDMWNPEQPITREEYMELFYDDSLSSTYPLEVVQGTSIEDFTEWYRNPEHEPCFEIPRDIWPDE